MMTYYEGLDYFKRAALSNINTIENITKEMFHITYPDLADEHNNAIDTDSLTLHKRIKLKLDRLVDQLRND